MLYVVKLDLSFGLLVCEAQDVVPLSAFLMFISVLFFKSLSALRSAGGRLFLGFEICISNFSAMSSILSGHKDPENEVRERESEAREDEIEIAVVKLKLPIEIAVNEVEIAVVKLKLP